MLPGDPDLPAPGPRQRRGDLPLGDPARLHQRDDGRLARGRRQDAGLLRLQCRRSPRRVAEMAHAVGASVEGELGVPRLARDRPGRGRGRPRRRGQLSPRPAPDRPRPGGATSSPRTRVDALAIAMGTSHGAYKFTRQPDGDILAMHVIEAIHERLPDTHLVMHGSLLGAAGAAGPLQRATAARCRRPGACRSRRSCAASATACARSTSTPTAGIAMAGQFRKVATETPARVRPAQVPEAGDGRARARSARERFEAVRHRRPGLEDQGRRRWPRWRAATAPARSTRRSPPPTPPERRPDDKERPP